jgi:hypothetical protein
VVRAASFFFFPSNFSIWTKQEKDLSANGKRIQFLDPTVYFVLLMQVLIEGNSTF